MKLLIDTDARTLTVEDQGLSKCMDLYSDAAFEVISRQWVRVGWNQKYQYTFSWLGRPVIQLPEDMIRMQEVIFQVQPDIILETGVAHGGSLIFYASLFAALGKGKVIGIDIDIRPHNYAAITAHPLSKYISLIQGSSVSKTVVEQAAALIPPHSTVMVILDSNHSYAHVYEELEAYAGLIGIGSYIVATDGIMEDLSDVPRGTPEWVTDNPTRAALDFAGKHPEFEIVQPTWPFNESQLSKNITHWPSAWLRRVR